jgi:hypothetical protein
MATRIFMTRWFDRFARKERIEPSRLIEAVERAEQGRADADLGGGVIKMRVARPDGGRSGGYRTLIYFRAGRERFSPAVSPRAIAIMSMLRILRS